MADSLKTLKCPACGKEMAKIFIPTEGINVDVCLEGCGGMYFDNRELEKFDENNEDVSKILEQIQGREFANVDTTVDRFCPNCGNKMVKNHSGINLAIEVDECYNCGGKFLDNDELQKIRAEYDNDTERSADVIRYVYKNVGKELAELDEKYCETKMNRSLYRKVFYKLLGM